MPAAGSTSSDPDEGRRARAWDAEAMSTTAVRSAQRFRSVRHELEDGILPLATSIDGHRFTFQAALQGLALRPGGHVTLETPGGEALGQVLDVRVAEQQAGELELALDDDAPPSLRAGMTLRYAAGTGVLL